jgi:hypothetical protein
MATLATAERPCTHPKLVTLYATVNPRTVPCSKYNISNTPPTGWKHNATAVQLPPWHNPNQTGTRRIVIQRDRTRMLTNVSRLTGAMHGPVTVYHPATHRSPTAVVGLFKSACMVVGYHGAGLANAVLATGPVCVLELSVNYAIKSGPKHWRSNCNALRRHPGVRLCKTVFLDTQALIGPNPEWNKVNWRDLDLDHHIKGLKYVSIPEDNITTVMTEIKEMESLCCGPALSTP